jgi:aconitate hydratase
LKIREDDLMDLTGLQSFAPGKTVFLVLHHADGTVEEISLSHSYSDLQIKWFKAGSALNYMKTL